MDNEEKPPMLKVPRLTPTIQTGQVMNFVGMIGLIWTVSNGLGNIIASQAAAMAEIRSNLSALQVRVERHSPAIEQESAINKVQDAKISNISEVVQEIRQSNKATLDNIQIIVGGMRDDIAALKAQSALTRRN